MIFHEIAIGLKSKTDGLYRYEVLFGYGKELQARYAQMQYTYEDMVEYDRFPNTKMGESSEFNFFEKLPPWMSVKWLELIAAICGDIVVEKWKDVAQVRK